MVPTRAGAAGWVSFPGQIRDTYRPIRCIRASPPGCSKASALPCIPSWHRRPLRPQPESPRSPYRLCRPCPRSLRRSCPRSRRSCLRFLSRSRPRLLRGPTRRPHCQGLLPTRQPPARPHRHPRLTPSMRNRCAAPIPWRLRSVLRRDCRRVQYHHWQVASAAIPTPTPVRDMTWPRATTPQPALRRVAQLWAIVCTGGMVISAMGAASSLGSRRARVAAQYFGASSRYRFFGQ
jgi:hypothetical protein